MAKISAIVLAAGTSGRMGDANKLFLNFHEKTIVQHVIENVLDSSVSEVVVVGSELSMERLASFNYQSVRLVENKEYQRGMTSSIQRGVEASNKEADGFMICLGDQPTIDSAIYSQLVEAFDRTNSEGKKNIVVPFHENKQGNPVIFSSYYKQDILVHEAPEGCRGILHSAQPYIKQVDIKNASVLNDIDTKEDYKAL